MAIVCVDLGGKRVGVAVSTSGTIATPHSVIDAAGDVVAQLAAIAMEYEAELFVVGLPRRRRSSDGEAKYARFAEELRQRTCKPVVLWDETLSTVAAADHLHSAGRRGRDARKDIDMYAAAVILQSYLDSESRRTP